MPNLLLDPRLSVAITELKDGQAVYKLTFDVEFGERAEGKARSTIHKLLLQALPAAGIEVGWSRSETRSVGGGEEGAGVAEPDGVPGGEG